MLLAGEEVMSADLVERMLGRMDDAFLCLDREGRFVYVNTRAGELLGREPRSLLGKELRSELPEGFPLRRACERALAEERPVQGEDWDASSGRWLESRVHQDPEGLAVFIRDVTARHEADEELRRVAAASAQAERMAHVGFWQWDVAANRVEWSDELYRIYGLEREDFGASFQGYLERVHADDRDRIRGAVEAALRERRPFTFEERIVRPDGSVRHLQSWGTVAVGASGEPKQMFGTCLDVTDRKRTERLLEGQSAVLERISMNAPLGESLELLARTMDAQAPGNLSSIVLLDADGKHIRHAAGPNLPEAYNRLVDGLPIGPAAGSCGTAAYRRERVFVSDIAKDPLWAEYRERTLPHGLRACWSTPIFGAEGALLGTFAIYRREPALPGPLDLEIIARATYVARIAIERKALQAQFLQAQKMETVGRLASGVAHDFNNVLSVIMSCSEVILARLAPDDPIRALVEEVRKAGHQASSLTRQLLILARPQAARPEILDLNAVVRDMDSLLRRLIRGGARLELELARELGPVRVDPGRAEQVILNLCVNARDAMARGGTITISTSRVDLATAATGVRGRVEPGSYVKLAVRDEGSGMPPDVVARLFEPFFTTKEPGKGTGLGLSTVDVIVRAAGGSIVVESEVGKGSTFAVYFPVAATS
jgi:PAS domain S-box-containing protein